MEPISRATTDIVSKSAEFGATVFVLVLVLVLLVIVLVGAFLLVRYVIRSSGEQNAKLMACLQALVPQIQSLNDKLEATSAISLRVEEKVGGCDVRAEKLRKAREAREEVTA